MPTTEGMSPLAAYRLISQTHTKRGADIEQAFGVLYKAAEQAEVRDAPPVAGALAEVDQAMADGFAADGTTKRHQVVALHKLAEAVRAAVGDTGG